jgi:hypothetical protein
MTQFIRYIHASIDTVPRRWHGLLDIFMREMYNSNIMLFIKTRINISQTYLCLREIDPCLSMSEGDWYLFTYVWGRLILVYLCLREIDSCLPMSEGDWFLFTYVWGRLILVYLCLREIDPYLPICLREIDPCLPMSEIDWSLFTYVSQYFDDDTIY